MPVKATPFIKLLQSVLQKSIDERLDQVKSILPPVESGAVKNTNALSRQFVTVLTSVTRSSDITSEQIALAAELRTRVDAIDPKNPDNDKPRIAEDFESKPKSQAPKISDGYEPDFLNLNEALARVQAKYGDIKPPYTEWENARLLQTFLGDGVTIDERSCRQAWLAFAFEFKKRGGSYEKPFTSLFPAQADWVQTAICSVANRNKYCVGTPPPNCLSIEDDLGFRS